MLEKVERQERERKEEKRQPMLPRAAGRSESAMWVGKRERDRERETLERSPKRLNPPDQPAPPPWPRPTLPDQS